MVVSPRLESDRLQLVPELVQVRQEIEALNTQASALCEGLTEEELGWRPGSRRWSIAENLVHLKVTADVFVPGADQAIEAARRRLYAEGPFRLGLLDRFFVWYVEPPPKIRLPAPKPLRPLLRKSATQALPDFLGSQRMMMERVEAANGLDLRRATVVSPLARFIKMSLLAFFLVFTGHGRRHLLQASSVRQQLYGRSAKA